MLVMELKPTGPVACSEFSRWDPFKGCKRTSVLFQPAVLKRVNR